MSVIPPVSLVELRRRVFASFAETAAPPELTADELALLEQGHAAMLDDGGRIEFANPFAVAPAAVRVHTAARDWGAVCPWDGLGILAALDADGRIDDGDGHALEVRDRRLCATEIVVHFLVPASRWYDDLRFT